MLYNTTCMLTRLANISCSLPIFKTDNEIANYIYQNYYNLTKECFIHEVNESNYCKIYFDGSNGKYRFKNQNGIILSDFNLIKIGNFIENKLNTEVICYKNHSYDGLVCADIESPENGIYHIDSSSNLFNNINNITGMIMKKETNDDNIIFSAEQKLYNQTYCELNEIEPWLEFSFHVQDLNLNEKGLTLFGNDQSVVIRDMQADIDVMFTENIEQINKIQPNVFYKGKINEGMIILTRDDMNISCGRTVRINQNITVRMHNNIKGNWGIFKNYIRDEFHKIYLMGLPGFTIYGVANIDGTLYKNPSFNTDCRGTEIVSNCLYGESHRKIIIL